MIVVRGLLKKYVLNASGPNDSNLSELETIAKSDSAAVMMKSCTIKPREGNQEPRYKRLPLGAIQSMGLPNEGYEKYVEYSSILKKYNKPVIASVAGFNADEYVALVKAFQNSDADLVEVNLSCPNIEGKSQVAYDFEQMEKILGRIENLGNKPIGLKLPAYLDLAHHKKAAEIILKHNVSFITCINSIGNTLVIDYEAAGPVIKTNGGLGGLCGDYIKPIALANVRVFYELLQDKIFIFGVGGIKSGTDAYEFLLAGADAVQVATVFEKEGPNCFERINNELNEILKRKNLTIESARGKLKNSKSLLIKQEK
ncbi:MAG: dihydroorotate oxidase [Candidatus Diapherotrites archaeon]|nr:dihydroorotate oxidase [Candidatus Diapherotrites archaeon]